MDRTKLPVLALTQYHRLAQGDPERGDGRGGLSLSDLTVVSTVELKRLVDVKDREVI